MPIPWALDKFGLCRPGNEVLGRKQAAGAHAKHTIINAVGIRNEDGSYYDRFGDPSLARGVLGAMIK